MRTRTQVGVGVAIVVVAVVAAISLRPLPDRAGEGDVAPPASAPSVTLEGEIAQNATIPLRLTDRRFEQDGSLLVSGTAPPMAPVAVLIDGREVERADPSAEGQFVIIGFIGHSDVPRRMDLISDPDGAALRADESFILDANPAPAPQVIVATEPAAPAELPLPEPTPVAASPTILAVTQEGVDVVQAPVAFDSPPEVMSNVALDTISYDPSGEIELRGRATGEGFVQVYVDNTPVNRLPIAMDGSWRGDLPDVDKGIYVLRIDELDPSGDVVSRIETPFLREDRADVIEAMAQDVAQEGFTVATRTVQPGATLWAIAEERYGSGVHYLAVFEANRDRIRDPDLIYPGQVFVIPDGDGPAPSAPDN